jgi:hypothetical protein
MPHMAAGRHHVYRDVTALALLAALIAAGVGSLSVALVLTAVALPAAVLVYIHDHRLWRDEPLTVILVAFGLSLLLGVGVGLLETHFVTLGVSGAASYYLPATDSILELGLLVPVVAFVAVVIAPLIVSARSAFSHPFDVVVAAALSGTALSLGLSVVVQHGAFTHVEATSGDPAHVAFIALTLGFLQPIVFATAATVAVLGLRKLGISPVVGVVEGLALVVAYELATTLLQPYGTRGIVLTALTAFVLAGAGLVAARNALHAAVTAATGVQTDAVDHRLHGGVVAAVVAIVVLVAAVVSAAVVWGGPSARPKPPRLGNNGILSHAAGAGFRHPGLREPGQSHWGNLALASHDTSLAAGTATAISLYQGVSIAPVTGWTVEKQGQQMVLLVNGDKSVGLIAGAGVANTSDINQEATFFINKDTEASGMTNVQQGNSGQVKSIPGKNFQQMLTVGYTGNVQNNQGTQQIYGVWAILYSPSNQISALVDAFSFDSDSLDAATQDIAAMIVSMAS